MFKQNTPGKLMAIVLCMGIGIMPMITAARDSSSQLVFENKYSDSHDLNTPLHNIDPNLIVIIEDTTMVWMNPFLDAFSDVNESDWFYCDVEYAVKNSLFHGTSATTFSPNTPITRAMLAVVLWRIPGSPEPCTSNTFADVAQGLYYEKAITWATEEHIIFGYGNGMFGPNDNLTREQLAAILHRYASSPAVTQHQFKFCDTTDISDWAFDSVMWASSKGLINGKPDGLLDPQGSATRAEAAAMLHRLLKHAENLVTDWLV